MATVMIDSATRKAPRNIQPWSRNSGSSVKAVARSAPKAQIPVVMIGGTEILRELQFLKQVFGPDFTPELYRMLLFGMAMVIVMIWKPRGFVASREPTAFLKERKTVSASFTKEGHG